MPTKIRELSDEWKVLHKSYNSSKLLQESRGKKYIHKPEKTTEIGVGIAFQKCRREKKDISEMYPVKMNEKMIII